MLGWYPFYHNGEKLLLPFKRKVNTMARKKIKAVKPAPIKARKLQPSVDDSIPEGFTMPASAQVPNWDYEKKKVLQGDLVSVKTITKKKPRKGESKTTRLMIVREQSGNLLQVWESASLHGLFDEVKKGNSLYIRFDGYGEKIKGRMPMKMFTAAYQKGK